MAGGNLAVAEGDQVVPVANSLIDSGRYDLIVASQDWHPAGHGSFASAHPGKAPFDMGELMARIRVALRIPQSAASAGRPAARGLHVDVAVRRATVDGASVRLSRKETELLALLMEARGEVVTHEAIIEAIWGRGTDADFMNVRVLAWQVRRKIEPDGSAPRFLIAEAGLGYRLSLD